jgi:hypothetical protein
MLYLHDFYNIIFKMKYKLYMYSLLVSPPPPHHSENSGCGPAGVSCSQSLEEFWAA